MEISYVEKKNIFNLCDIDNFFFSEKKKTENNEK